MRTYTGTLKGSDNSSGPAFTASYVDNVDVRDVATICATIDNWGDKTMSIVARVLIAVTAMVGVIGSALAADMTGAEIKAFLSGKTVYLETTAASASGQAGQGVIFWAEDGAVLYKTPSGAIMHGKWEIKGNTNCTDWKERPNTPCVRYDKVGDTVTVIDAASGQLRAKIVRTAPGNAEKLAP
jgi:hypothetical protein